MIARIEPIDRAEVVGLVSLQLLTVAFKIDDREPLAA